MSPANSVFRVRVFGGFFSAVLSLVFFALPAAAGPAGNQTAGSVKAMLPDASLNAHPLAVNDALQWNDLLQTDAKGRVRAGLNDGSILSVGSNSQLKIVQHDASAQQTVIDLNYGKLRNQVTKITQPQGKYQVRTANAVIGVIGTDFYVAFEKERTTVICYEGVVSVAPVDNTKILGSTDVPVGPDGSVMLRPGQIVIMGPKIARSETLLYPVLMQASQDDTDVPDVRGPAGKINDSMAKGEPASRPGSGSSARTETNTAGGAEGNPAVRLESGSVAAAVPGDTNAETQLVALINESRKENGLPPLTMDPRLTEAARKHTQLMAQNGALSHQFPGEPPLQDRIDQENLPSDVEAENVGWDINVVAAHKSLVDDPPHLRNILDPECNVVGVGVIRRGSHIFVTEDFARLVPEQSKQQ